MLWQSSCIALHNVVLHYTPYTALHLHFATLLHDTSYFISALKEPAVVVIYVSKCVQKGICVMRSQSEVAACCLATL